MVKLLMYFQLCDFKIEKKMKAKIEKNRKQSTERKRIAVEVKTLRLSKKKEAQKVKGRNEAKEEVAMMKKKVQNAKVLVQKWKWEVEKKIEKLDRQKLNFIRLEVVEAIELVIMNTKEMKKLVEKNSKEL